ncbi:MAG: hypothetical protein KIS77_03775 [Saprospiraceae bacterium]|nr:hypothetical protein [Saprospiraceae bacterium]
MNQPLKTSFVEKLRAQTEQAEEEGKYFGFDRQENGRALMFELRTRDGRRSALPYSYMTRAEFDPSGGIEIFVSSAVILIKGRGLEAIFAYLLQNRLTWVREDSSGMDTEDETVFVEGIEVKERGEIE